jgi:predicted nucleotidyltransferase
MAVENGVDLVVELPSFYSNESAEIFALGAIKILDSLKSDSICFGSEAGEVESLQNIVEFSETKEFSERVKELLKDGISYPNAMRILIEEEFGENSLNPNNILGIEYIRAIKKIKSEIKPFTIKREKVGYFDLGFKDEIASATGIRAMLKEKEYDKLKKLMPPKTYEILMNNLDKLAFLDDYYTLIKFKVLNDRDNLRNITDMEEGLWNRVYDICKKTSTLDEFMKEFVNKRYTLSRTKRILCHILLNLTNKEREVVKQELPFVRVLAFNKKGAEYLKYLKKEHEIVPLISNKNVNNLLQDKELFERELARDEIYKLIHPYTDQKFAINKKED